LFEKEFLKYNNWKLTDILLSEEELTEYEKISVVQPVLMAVQVALAKLWEHYGVKPYAVTGHSMGEIAAFWAAGAISTEDAAKIICYRSQLMETTANNNGAMLATELSYNEAVSLAQKYGNKISAAVYNSPNSMVLSGDKNIIEIIQNELEKKDLFCRQVKVTVASHSPQMDNILQPLKEKLNNVIGIGTDVRLFSTSANSIVTAEDLTTDFWLKNLRNPVMFYPVMQQLFNNNCNIFIEVSPHPVLVVAMKQCAEKENFNVKTLPSTIRNTSEKSSILKTLAAIYESGVNLNFNSIVPQPQHFMELPSYPFQKEEWIFEKKINPTNNFYSIENKHIIGIKMDLAGDNNLSVWNTVFSPEIHFQHTNTTIEETQILPYSFLFQLVSVAFGELHRHKQPFFTLQRSTPRIIGQKPIQIQLKIQNYQNTNSLQIFARNEEEKQWSILLSGSYFLNHQKTSENQATNLNSISEDSHFIQTHFELSASLSTDNNLIYNLWEKSMQIIETEAKKYFEISKNHILQPTSFTDFVAPNNENNNGKFHFSAVYKVNKERKTIVFENITITNQKQTFLKIQDISFILKEKSELELHKFFLKTTWKDFQIPDISQKQTKWLVFAANNSFSKDIVNLLQAEGNEVITILKGYEYSYESNENLFYVNPLVKENFTLLFYEIHSKINFSCDNILFLWTTDDTMNTSNYRNIQQILELKQTSILYCIQSYYELFFKKLPRFHIVANTFYPNSSTDLPINLSSSPLFGLVRSLRYDLPYIKTTLYEWNENISNYELLLQLLQLQQDNEFEFSIGKNQIMVPRISQIQKQELNVMKQYAIEENATYIISGGYGGLGWAYTKWLISKGSKNIVLLGRIGTVNQDIQSEIEELKSKGYKIEVHKIDVAKFAEVQKLISYIETNFPPIKGIFHTAGTLNDSFFLNYDRKKYMSVFDAKVLGACNLAEVTNHLSTDFIVFFSSVASLIGMPGQANYCAANAFLDSFAAHLNRNGRNALTINFGSVTDFGLATQNKFGVERLQNEGMYGYPAKFYIDLMENVFFQAITTVGIVHFNFNKWLEAYSSLQNNFLFENIFDDKSNSTENEDVVNLFITNYLNCNDVAKKRKLLEMMLFKNVSILAGVPETRLSASNTFKSYGLDSLMYIQLNNKIKKETGIGISVASFYAHPVISDFVDYLVEMIENKVPKQNSNIISENKPTIEKDDFSDKTLKELSDLLDNEIDKILN